MWRITLLNFTTNSSSLLQHRSITFIDLPRFVEIRNQVCKPAPLFLISRELTSYKSNFIYLFQLDKGVKRVTRRLPRHGKSYMTPLTYITDSVGYILPLFIYTHFDRRISFAQTGRNVCLTLKRVTLIVI